MKKSRVQHPSRRETRISIDPEYGPILIMEAAKRTHVLLLAPRHLRERDSLRSRRQATRANDGETQDHFRLFPTDYNALACHTGYIGACKSTRSHSRDAGRTATGASRIVESRRRDAIHLSAVFPTKVRPEDGHLQLRTFEKIHELREKGCWSIVY